MDRSASKKPSSSTRSRGTVTSSSRPNIRAAYSAWCCESPRLLMSNKMPGIPSWTDPAWANCSPSCVFPIPVDPTTTVSVPGSNPPPSITSSCPIPVESRVFTFAISHHSSSRTSSRLQPQASGLEDICHDPAVHHKCLARDVTSRVTGQQQGRTRDLFRLAPTAHCRAAGRRRLAVPG